LRYDGLKVISKKNPFPGMNPYFEREWPDVHTQLIAEIRNALGPILPPGLVARSEESIAVDEIGGDLKGIRPDVTVVERESWRFGTPPVWSPGEHVGPDGVVSAVPEIIGVEDETDRWVEIRTAAGKVITVIEVISPGNREGRGYGRYKKKQRACLLSNTSLVEIDLIRSGESVIAVPESRLLHRVGTHGFVCVYRGGDFWQRELYPCPLRQRLPAISIPLRLEDKDVVLDLQPFIDRCYELGGYWQGDYRSDPSPPLLPEENEWLDGCLRAAGLRGSA